VGARRQSLVDLIKIFKKSRAQSRFGEGSQPEYKMRPIVRQDFAAASVTNWCHATSVICRMDYLLGGEQ